MLDRHPDRAEHDDEDDRHDHVEGRVGQHRQADRPVPARGVQGEDQDL